MRIYKAKPSPPDGRKITFPDSNHLFVEAMAAGNDIFDETGEIPVVPECLEVVVFFSDNGGLSFSTSTNPHGFPVPAS